jgi:HAD superfamily hydrolase (TIGR01509 family)
MTDLSRTLKTTPERSHRSSDSTPALLFDLDGTLIDSVYEHVDAWASALADAGIVLPKWKIHRRIGMSGQSFVTELLREHVTRKRGISIERLESERGAKFKKVIPKLKVLPGARELLRHLSRVKVRWAIATSGERSQVGRLLRDLNIPKSIPVVTGDDVQRAKPAPDVFVMAAEKLETTVSESVIIGDSPWDMLAAVRKGGLAVGLLSGGYSDEELWRAGAIRIYESPADLLVHLEDLGIPGK